jgi:hypothetical protein
MNQSTKNFALLFRMDISGSSRPSPQQMEQYMKSWNQWTGSIEANSQLLTGNHFSQQGVVLKPGNETEHTPYNVGGVSVAGYIIISARDLTDAMAIGAKCPILNGEHTSVEIRELAAPGE